MKNILVITSSFRKNSNSNALAKAFAEGASEAGHTIEIVSLSDKKLGFCRGCLACQSIGKCVIDDDANGVTEKMKNADAVVFATPVYYYSISGQLKTALDRANSLYVSEYAFRDVYLLATAADDAEDAVSGAEKAIQGWVDCFENATLKGVIFAGGVDKAGDISGREALKKAYEAGRSA